MYKSWGELLLSFAYKKNKEQEHILNVGFGKDVENTLDKVSRLNYYWEKDIVIVHFKKGHTRFIYVTSRYFPANNYISNPFLFGI